MLAIDELSHTQRETDALEEADWTAAEPALESLSAALPADGQCAHQLGSRHVELPGSDPDLDALRADPSFKKLHVEDY